MTRIIATHAVANMDVWLAGQGERREIFRQFSSGYRIYRQPGENRVAIVWEDADLAKVAAVINDPEALKARARHGVLEPIDIYVEIEGGG